MSECVLDASASAAWFLHEAGSKAALRLLEPNSCTFHVPAVWLPEMASVFAKRERRGLGQAAETARYLTILAALDLHWDNIGTTFSGMERILERARASRVSAYDAQYLELALRLRLPLATLDTGLAAAAREAGVRLSLGAARLGL